MFTQEGKKNVFATKSLTRLSLAKDTMVWVRFVLTGVSSTGAETVFFIELQSVNPLFSPNKTVLGYKNTARIGPEDLQNALAGTESAKSIGLDDMPQPSYIAVRAGTLGVGAKQLAVYDSSSHIVTGKEQIASISGCTFGDEVLKGSILITAAQLQEHPEYLCQAGAMEWDIKYCLDVPLRALYKRQSYRWWPVGAKASFSGSIVLDGEKYEVSGSKSHGYADFTEAKKSVLLHTISIPYFHISSSFLTSHITGRVMKDSCVVVHGLYGNNFNSAAIGLKLGDKVITLPGAKRGVRTIAECVEAAADEDGPRLHWSMSVDLKDSYSKYVIDVDVMCHTKLLSVRNIELPEGKRRVMRLLQGGSGTGTVRLFQHVKKDLVLIEEAHIASALCEFGQLDGGLEPR